MEKALKVLEELKKCMESLTAADMRFRDLCNTQQAVLKECNQLEQQKRDLLEELTILCSPPLAATNQNSAGSELIPGA